ncbi:MAG: cytochrome c3 family protein [Hyphomicrobiaceae bacterium]
MGGTSTLWFVWTLATAAGATMLLAGMLYGGGLRARLLIGATTHGHHQIELACDACHTRPFGGGPVLQEACVGCHAQELKEAKDSHPAKKFADPRNADRLEKLDATQCVTCHREHKPDITNAMGVTLPTDYCALCHQDIGKERPSHAGLAFDTCASAGCHNYHDNRALYADFLVKHGREPDLNDKAVVKLRLFVNAPADPRPPLARAAADAPADKVADTAAVEDWLASAHARAGVNCSGCHGPLQQAQKSAPAGAWSARPDHTVCATCHAQEARTFTQGMHGMRLANGLMSSRSGLRGLFKDRPLTPMRPELAQLPMAAAAHGRDVVCTTCHAAHRFETAAATQVETCLGCHADEHSKAYVGSPHHKLWLAEQAGAAEKGTGVSCATCHLPRLTVEDDSGMDRMIVNHNQNANLRPNEKMVRSVCASCHGLPFTLDALADPDLVRRNFAGRPARHIPSIDWALEDQRTPH